MGDVPFTRNSATSTCANPSVRRGSAAQVCSAAHTVSLTAYCVLMVAFSNTVTVVYEAPLGAGPAIVRLSAVSVAVPPAE